MWVHNCTPHTFQNGFNQQERLFRLSPQLWRPWKNQSLTVEYATESVHRVDGYSAYDVAITNSAYWMNPAAIASGQSGRFPPGWRPITLDSRSITSLCADPSGRTSDPYALKTPLMNQYQAGLDKPLDVTLCVAAHGQPGFHV